MASNQLLSLAGWYFLPNLVTSYLQPALYTIFIRAGDPKPQPGTARFNRDRRNLQVAVIVAYLLYTIYEADYQLQLAGDFYRLLGLTPSATEREVQSKFRRLTVQFHPDKASGPDKAQIERIYVQLQIARDTLVDPAKRFAYDRFGPDILGWQNCKLIRDFIFSGLQGTLVYYIGSAVALVGLGVLGYLRQGVFWRYLVMAGLFVIEMHAATRPHFPALLTQLVNPMVAATGLRSPYLPFQMITLLRKLAVTFFIAMSQLGPLLQDPKQAPAGDGSSIAPQQLDRIDALAAVTDQELQRLLGFELTPFAIEEKAAKELRGTLKDWLVQNSIRNDPEVKMAIEKHFERRRQEGVEEMR
ncbi:Chaperone protein DnaJ [Pseudocercospora fuligena]|uniref:Chaperone protein DnaJ n=1 Tax=Pseudocercospora fuligena TaxID=685502 RepID=A0A8H6RGI5_9PEZI|nr:Chaperone protein DnaJ [Pseudocercospora fuligena]